MIIDLYMINGIWVKVSSYVYEHCPVNNLFTFRMEISYHVNGDGGTKQD